MAEDDTEPPSIEPGDPRRLAVLERTLTEVPRSGARADHPDQAVVQRELADRGAAQALVERAVQAFEEVGRIDAVISPAEQEMMEAGRAAARRWSRHPRPRGSVRGRRRPDPLRRGQPLEPPVRALERACAMIAAPKRRPMQTAEHLLPLTRASGHELFSALQPRVSGRVLDVVGLLVEGHCPGAVGDLVQILEAARRCPRRSWVSAMAGAHGVPRRGARRDHRQPCDPPRCPRRSRAATPCSAASSTLAGSPWTAAVAQWTAPAHVAPSTPRHQIP